MPFRLCWFDFGVLFPGFCAILFSRVQLRLHWCVTWCMMNGYNVKAHGSVLMRVWASPYALQVLNYDACAFELWCENARMSCLQLCAFGDVLSHLNTYVVALLVKYRSCLWRYGCDVGHADWRETWKIFGCENVLKFYSHSISVHILQLLTIPPLFFTGSDDKTVRIWDVAAQQQVAELKGHTSTVMSVAFDSSGKYLASGERRGAWAAARYDCAMNVMAFVARIAIGIWMVMVVYE